MVPTGWGVVTDLIRSRGGALQGEQEARDADADPEGWWAGQGHGERYDTLLDALAPSLAARRDLLNSYFEPASDHDRNHGIK